MSWLQNPTPGRAAPARAAGHVGSAALGGFALDVWTEPFQLELRSQRSGRVVLGRAAGIDFCRAGQAAVQTRWHDGLFDFSQKLGETLPAWSVRRVQRSGGAIELEAAFRPEGPAPASGGSLLVTLRAVQPEGTIRISLRSTDPAHNRLLVSFPSAGDESFLGLGEQYNRVRHEGTRVPIWVSEQGNGRTDGRLRLPFTGRTTDNYFPIPFYLSTRGYGLLADTPARTVFGLRAPPETDRVTVEVGNSDVTLHLVDGPTPAEVVRRLAAWTGRPRPLPEWAFGTWIGVQGGREQLESRLETLRDAGAAVDAIWVQDWVGGVRTPVSYGLRYHWTEDPQTYPDLPGLIRDLHRVGLRFIGTLSGSPRLRLSPWRTGLASGRSFSSNLPGRSVSIPSSSLNPPSR